MYHRHGIYAAGIEDVSNTTTTAAPGVPPCVPSDSDVSWMLVASVLVLGMLPGLSFFESGLLRGKNTTSITVQVFSGMTILCTMWILFGFSLVFDSSQGGFIGGVKMCGMQNVGYNDCYPGTVIPSALYALFQMMFAAITPLLMTGAFAERLAWRPFIILMILWEVIVYYPVAHWMWNPDGWLNKMGAQDFAGGIVIHVTAGASSLVSVLILGRRRDFHIHHGEAPYSSLPIACIGASLLWTGWFGFNGGSALASGGLAIHAVMNSQIAASVCSCCFLVWALFRTKRPSMVGIINGAIAGLAGITPCAGYVGLGYGILLSIVLALTAHISMFFVKHKFKIDDALDVSCVHGVPGLVGAIWTGFFADVDVGGDANGVAFGGDGKLLGVQILACLVCGVWACFWTFAIMKVTGMFIPLRVSATAEKAGLDLHEHNEVAWLTEQLSPGTSFAIVPVRKSQSRPSQLGASQHIQDDEDSASSEGRQLGGIAATEDDDEATRLLANARASHLGSTNRSSKVRSSKVRELTMSQADLQDLILSRAVAVVGGSGHHQHYDEQDEADEYDLRAHSEHNFTRQSKRTTRTSRAASQFSTYNKDPSGSPA